MSEPHAPLTAETLTVLEGRIQIRICANSAATGGIYSFYELICEPGSGPPLHFHHDVEEAFYVMEGEFLFQIGERRIRGTPGWFGIGPRNIPHTFVACGTQPAKMVMVVSPAGLEEFFRGLSALTSSPSADMEAVTALFEAHGMQIVGPPLKPAYPE